MSNDRIYYSRAAEERAKREQMVLTVVFLLLGLSIGAVLALLFAPSSGRDTRQEISSTVGEQVETGREATNRALHRLESEFAELRKRLEDRLN